MSRSVFLSALLIFVVSVGGCGSDNDDVSSDTATEVADLPPPEVTSPEDVTVISNDSFFQISGTCPENLSVTLSGDETQSSACTGGVFRFNIIKKRDGTYDFELKTTDGERFSVAVDRRWIRDTSRPDRPELIAPGANPYMSAERTVTLKVNCESGAQVRMTGDAEKTARCERRLFSAELEEDADGTYEYRIVQTDRAGNESNPFVFTWTIQNTMPPTPVITSPTENPFRSTSNALEITGTCQSGFGVILSGDDQQSVPCATEGTFSFSIKVGTDDVGTYNYKIFQSDGVLNSGKTSLQWIYAREDVEEDESSEESGWR